MKRLNFIILCFVFITVIISCNSIESDARRVAEINCKIQKLIHKSQAGDISAISEGSKLANEEAALVKEMEVKYTTDKDKQKYAEALLKASADCK